MSANPPPRSLSAFDQLQLRVQDVLASTLKWLRRFFLIDILFQTIEAFSTHRMPELAAALAYYGVLALFPLLLVLIALSSTFVAGNQAVQQAIHFVGQYLPGAELELQGILAQVLVARGPATLIGVVTLVWSASGLFDVLQNGMSRAWNTPAPRSLIKQRLYSIAAVGGLGLLFLVSVVVSTVTNDAVQRALGQSEASVELTGNVLGFVASFLAFVVLYRVFPNAYVPWLVVLTSALTAALLWEFAKHIYEIYLLYFARFNLVYGSVGALIGLLLWMYISGMILLFGGELAAVLGRKRRMKAEGDASSR